MAFKIRDLLTPQQRLRLDRTRDELARIHGLPDRWLAEELLRLARATRQAHPDKLADPHGVTYEPNFVWQVVPEVARRLGATRLLPNEATSADVKTVSDAELRRMVGVYLQNTVLDRWDLKKDSDTPGPGEILGHNLANGNPVAMAADRLAPAPEAGHDRDDWIARHTREISRRRGHEETPYWSPELQGSPAPGPEEDGAPVPQAPRR